MMASLRLANVPRITLAFWLLNTATATLGEAGSTVITQSLNMSAQAYHSVVMGSWLLSLVLLIMVCRKGDFLFWIGMLLTLLVGVLAANTLHHLIPGFYLYAMALIGLAMMGILGLWKTALGNLSLRAIDSRFGALLFWLMMVLSQTLGTLLGDWTAHTPALGYQNGLLLVTGLLLVPLLLLAKTRLSRALIFWPTVVLVRPLSGALSDFLDQPLALGGLDLSQMTVSVGLLAFITLLLMGLRPTALKSLA